MKTVYLFVADETGVEFLRRVLAPELTKDVEFIRTSPDDRDLSRARSILRRKRMPAAVLMDSASLDTAVIWERRVTAEDLLKFATGPTPAKVVTAIPEIEAWFFAAPESIERVLGEKIPPDFVPLGKRDPKGILDWLARKSKRPWDMSKAIKGLDAEDIERIRAVPAVSELSAFLQSVLKDDRAA